MVQILGLDLFCSSTTSKLVPIMGFLVDDLLIIFIYYSFLGSIWIDDSKVAHQEVWAFFLPADRSLDVGLHATKP